VRCPSISPATGVQCELEDSAEAHQEYGTSKIHRFVHPTRTQALWAATEADKERWVVRCG
jgi:hypothetical protein